MKHTLLNLTFGLCLAAVGAGAAEVKLQAAAIQVEDGDTLLIELDGQPQRVQLNGIDAPEDSDNPKLQRDLARTGLAPERLLELGRTATRYLQMLTANDDPYVLVYEPDTLDRYGRLTAELYSRRGDSLGDFMVQGGYAVPTGPAAERLQPAREEAQRLSRGLWQKDPQATALWAGVATPSTAAPAAPKHE